MTPKLQESGDYLSTQDHPSFKWIGPRVLILQAFKQAPPCHLICRGKKSPPPQIRSKVIGREHTVFLPCKGRNAIAQEIHGIKKEKKTDEHMLHYWEVPELGEGWIASLYQQSQICIIILGNHCTNQNQHFPWIYLSLEFYCAHPYFGAGSFQIMKSHSVVCILFCLYE